VSSRFPSVGLMASRGVRFLSEADRLRLLKEIDEEQPSQPAEGEKVIATSSSSADDGSRRQTGRTRSATAAKKEEATGGTTQKNEGEDDDGTGLFLLSVWVGVLDALLLLPAPAFPAADFIERFVLSAFFEIVLKCARCKTTNRQSLRPDDASEARRRSGGVGVGPSRRILVPVRGDLLGAGWGRLRLVAVVHLRSPLHRRDDPDAGPQNARAKAPRVLLPVRRHGLPVRFALRGQNPELDGRIVSRPALGTDGQKCGPGPLPALPGGLAGCDRRGGQAPVPEARVEPPRGEGVSRDGQLAPEPNPARHRVGTEEQEPRAEAQTQDERERSRRAARAAAERTVGSSRAPRSARADPRTSGH
jgi:hypothetical protein